ncbi:MAG: META domain-containing protein [Caldilineaceae bacterium]
MHTKSFVTRTQAVICGLLFAGLLLSACTVAVPQPAAPMTAPSAPPTAEAAPESADGTASITANPWQWIAYSGPVEQFDVETPQRFVLAFGEDNSLAVLADCNRASGSYTAADSAVTVEIGPMTRAMCPPDSRSDQFVRLLGGAAIYFFDGDNLLIDLFADGGTLTFAPAPADVLDAAPAVDVAAILGNLTYNGVLPEQPITLTDGVGEYTEDGPGTPFVRLIDHLIPTGDLNGDSLADAAAILVDNTTGSADFVYVVAVLDVDGAVTPTDALQLGDRTPVQSMTVDGGQITVDLIAGFWGRVLLPHLERAQNLRCGRRSTARDEQRRTQPGFPARSGRHGLATSQFGEGQASLLPDSEITLSFADGQVSGSAGCNDYTGGISGDDTLPQVMTVGPLAVTAMMCAEPITNQETAYLDALAKVSAWRYDFGFLALTYRLEDGTLYELSFTPAP